MFHLKKKVKNLSRVEGSIVAQTIKEETSNFSAYYFAPHIQTKSRKPGRNDDGGEKPHYISDVPDIFAQVGRLSGKRKKRWISRNHKFKMHIVPMRLVQPTAWKWCKAYRIWCD